MNGIKKLGEEFSGEIWIETFIIEDINDSKEEIDGLYNFFKDINYTKIQLNRLDRAGTEKWVLPAKYERLSEIETYLIDKGLKNVEVIGKCHIDQDEKIKINEELLDNMKSKRKYSTEEIKFIYK